MHLKGVLGHFQLTDGRLLGMASDIASYNCLMPLELESMLEVFGIGWPALRNHIPCMAHVIQLALGAFMNSVGVKGHTKSWKAHERNQQLGGSGSIEIGKNQRLWKDCNARINKVSAMRPELAKIIEKLHISRYLEHPQNDLRKAENTCCIDYTYTWSTKRVHWQSKNESLHRGTTGYGCDDTLELDSLVSAVSQSITRIYQRVAPKSKIQWLLATFHNTGWMDHYQVYHGSFEAILILDPVYVDKAYSPIASHHPGL